MEGVTKRFGDVVALRGLDLTVEEGEIFGFLGPNGAGKSTTIKILLNLKTPTDGSATVLGMDAQEESLTIRKRTGVLPEGFEPYPRLTAREHLEFAIESKDANENPGEILRRVGLQDAIDRKTGGFSTGMKQRLGLGIALIGRPDLLILDEPTSGLDPNGARQMREIIATEHDRGATVMFSSHILEQVEATCDRVGILRNGELVASDDIDSLRESIGNEATLRITATNVSDETVSAVELLEGVSEVRFENGSLLVGYDDAGKMNILNTIEDTGAVVEDFSVEQASLEELFEAYTTKTES